MPSPITGTKHATFKLRASKELPTREFKVEFNSTGVRIKKAGVREDHHLRWRPLLGQMLLFGGNDLPANFTNLSWRTFLLPLKAPAKELKAQQILFEFSDKGVYLRQERVFWTWRTLLNVAITGI